jgi:hypothetical protein
MPLTFPSHAGVVVPLKLWRPRWFDGVALVIGSAAPDLTYALDPYVHLRGHTWWGLVWFCVPVTVAGTLVARRAAPLVAAHLPDGGPLRLRDYGVLGAVRHPWPVTVVSAYLGALSHRLWDVVTHASIDSGTVSVAALSRSAIAGQPWWRVLFYGSTVLGAFAVLAAAVYIGRRRLLVGWHGPAPRLPLRRPRFLTAAVATWAVGAGVQSLLRGAAEHQILGVRLLLVAALGLIAGAVAARSGPEPASGASVRVRPGTLPDAGQHVGGAP